MRASIASAAFALLFVGTGCFTKQYYVPRFISPPPGMGKRIVLHDVAATNALPLLGDAPMARLDLRIRSYLEAHGYQLGDTSAAIKVAYELGQEAPAETYAKSLGEHHLCDLLIIPRLVMRQAQLQNSQARWDGVLRPIPSEGGNMVWSGYEKAASISIRVYTCDGELVLDGAGGIDVAFGVFVSEQNDHPGTQPLTGNERTTASSGARDYLSNPVYVDEAIALALHPLIPMSGYPDTPEPYLGPH